ncbi:DUF6461 domain-containing protein [Actinoplanes sp. NPDC049265]|uniref:DUF6461 domain-containing protein n=1 Tax=Actinoplanes sp. NPDC049265 TaxID=3363902 RepID=UPI00371885ED
MKDLADARALADRLGESYELVYVKDDTGWSVSRAAPSRETLETVTVSRGPGTSHFSYAVAGETIVAFDPGYPAPETTWGTDPARLSHLMTALGLRPPDDESDDSWRDADARALLLAERVTGLLEDPAGRP